MSGNWKPQWVDFDDDQGYRKITTPSGMGKACQGQICWLDWLPNKSNDYGKSKSGPRSKHEYRRGRFSASSDPSYLWNLTEKGELHVKPMDAADGCEEDCSKDLSKDVDYCEKHCKIYIPLNLDGGGGEPWDTRAGDHRINPRIKLKMNKATNDGRIKGGGYYAYALQEPNSNINTGQCGCTRHPQPQNCYGSSFQVCTNKSNSQCNLSGTCDFDNGPLDTQT